MRTIYPKQGNRIAVSAFKQSIVSTIDKVELDPTSQFWSIFFGDPMKGDSGIVVLDEDMVREIFDLIQTKGKE